MYEEKAQTKHSSINCRRKIAYIDDLFTHTSPIHRTSGKSNFQLSFIAAFSKILFSIHSLCASICLDFGCCCCILCIECTLVLTHFIFNFTIIRYRKINSWANKSHETQNLNCSLKRSCSLYACKAKQSCKQYTLYLYRSREFHPQAENKCIKIYKWIAIIENAWNWIYE